jgi:hypothetical protein
LWQRYAAPRTSKACASKLKPDLHFLVTGLALVTFPSAAEILSTSTGDQLKVPLKQSPHILHKKEKIDEKVFTGMWFGLRLDGRRMGVRRAREFFRHLGVRQK